MYFFVLLLISLAIFVRSVPDIIVPLKFGDEELQLTFPSTDADARVMARKFCSERTSAATADCFTPVSEFLVSKVKEWHDKEARRQLAEDDGTLVVTIEIGGTNYNLTYHTKTESARLVAVQFCREYYSARGETITGVEDCIGPVTNALMAAYESHYAELQFAI